MATGPTVEYIIATQRIKLLKVTIKSHFSKKRHWLSTKVKLDYSAEIPTSKNLICLISQGLIDNILSKIDDQLVDLKGVGDSREELFYLSGVTELKSGAQSIPFQFSLWTEFLQYRGRHSIVFKLCSDRTNLPAEFDWRALARVPGLRPTEVKFSIEHLRDRALVPWLGSFPTVDESLVLKVSAHKIEVSLKAERLPNENTLPFYDTVILKSVSSVLENIAGVSLLSDIAAPKRIMA